MAIKRMQSSSGTGPAAANRFAEEICHDCTLHEAHCMRGRIAGALHHVGCSGGG
jgi:hypothetical protein